MSKDESFLTNNGYTCLKRERISAYTITEKHYTEMSITQVDVFMGCGTVFTINSSDVERFLQWVGELNG
mgnify:FL=1|jgi:hypothetical protein|tara:strand:- start:206 stop:412 length:207 start_codon:yes stop_codon:yes gene_type:complete